MRYFCSVEQGLGWHATSEDAKASDFSAAFDDSHAKFVTDSASGCGITSTATADDDEIVVPL
jgi:hypothetical protein